MRAPWTWSEYASSLFSLFCWYCSSAEGATKVPGRRIAEHLPALWLLNQPGRGYSLPYDWPLVQLRTRNRTDPLRLLPRREGTTPARGCLGYAGAGPNDAEERSCVGNSSPV